MATRGRFMIRQAGSMPEWWRRAFEGPSAWPVRIIVAVLALLGFAVSLRLALFQYGVAGAPWEPWFGDGSVRVLDSAFSRALPVRDAALGAAAYLLEMVLELSGGTRRWRRRPWLVLVLGLTAAAMALTAIGLVLVQALVVGTFCTLCLLSAAISLTVPFLVAEEVVAAWRQIRRAHRYGVPWKVAVRGEGV
ncbi:vitamin K epoxide reductase family protein [Dactylosporangium sp. CA-139114]|uniref:vitamin K epoxide reductase family protein n=1 Tax=Dactylosporangium sp. CA-139114 TaxID=3239931 RepID=UPI003D9570AC